jgi:hypothetical protein
MYKHQWHVVRAIKQLRDQGLDISLLIVGSEFEKARKTLDHELIKSDPKGLFVKKIGMVSISTL